MIINKLIRTNKTDNTSTYITTVQYKQKVRTNEVKTQNRNKKTKAIENKTYHYKEVTIPADIVKYFETLLNGELLEVSYIVIGELQYITPFNVEGVDWSGLDPSYNQDTRPERSPVFQVRRQGNPKRPRYYIRFRGGVELADFITFTLNTSIIDVTAPEGVELLGVWEVSGLQLV